MWKSCSFMKIKHVRFQNLCSLVFSRTLREISEAFSERNKCDAKNKNTTALHLSVEHRLFYRLTSIPHPLSPTQEQSWTFIGNYIYLSNNPTLKNTIVLEQQRALYRLNSGWSAYLFSVTCSFTFFNPESAGLPQSAHTCLILIEKKWKYDEFQSSLFLETDVWNVDLLTNILAVAMLMCLVQLDDVFNRVKNINCVLVIIIVGQELTVKH